ncbi:hypothetical protein FSP39_005284 [Pinctada imbricata]|uniref:D-beta-hydroxybutyrate dehydrogenase, mitochondrial n=1 Tax=Pinctada imbricata TaxID=66713 RepID=A0AA88XPZ9_PINIB|nr:hypothetical protein FSP39_005284 [Pinctada imbricata]
MNVKQFVGLDLFESLYLAVLAVLPFLVIQSTVSFSLLIFAVLIGGRAVYKQWTYRTVDTDGKRVLITGCDSGFGFTLARRLSSKGILVYAGCLIPNGEGANQLLNSESADKICVVPLDVRSDKSVQELYDQVVSDGPEKGLWGVVNNAAINFMGDVEFCTMEMFKRVAEVNMFGAVRVTKMFLGLVRKEKGRIVNVSSAKGLICNPSTACYGMTKYAIETFSDILRLEMRKFSVRVVVIEPGNYGGSTNMLSKNTLDGLKSDFETMWKEAGEDTKRIYPRDYLTRQYQSVVDSAATASKTIRPVIDAMESAVIAVNPQFRYHIDGGNSIIDYNSVSLREYQYH